MWAGGVAVSILLSCGEPLPPRPHGWREVAEFPASNSRVHALAVAGDVVYVAGADREAGGNDRATIYRYAGGAVEPFFKAPYPESAFYDVRCGGGYVWACGFKRVGGVAILPYLARYDGSRWEEVDVPPSVATEPFRAVRPAGGGRCWLVGMHALYSYEDGVWRKHLSAGRTEYFYLAVTPTGRAYAYLDPGAPYQTVKIYVSDDGGGSWATERAQLPTRNFISTSTQPGGMEVVAWGERLCWGARLAVPGSNEIRLGARYYAVLVRDEAPPGQGSYEIAFMAPCGPYFYDIRGLAFRDDENGCVVGTFTSVALDDGEWIQEVLPESWRPRFDGVAAGAGSYWAFGAEYGSPPYRLYRAPWR